MPYGVRLSQDLREVVLYMRTMLTNSKIIEYTGLPKSTVNSIIQVYNTTGRIGNSPEPGKKAIPTSRSKLSEGEVDVCTLSLIYMMLIDQIQYILTILNDAPATYLEDIRLMLKGVGVEVHTSTIWRALKRRNYSMKTVSFLILAQRIVHSHWFQPMKAAKEANTRLQDEYMLKISDYKRRSLVFIDESSFDRRASIRKRAWAKVGHRVIEKVPFLRGRR
jgi:hypothetical protein